MISPTRAKSSGSETLLRIRSLAGCTIDTHESSFRKRHLADLDAELQQFPVDAGRPPQRVGFAHAADQITDFCADLGVVPDGVIATTNRAGSPCDAIGTRLPA